VCPFALDVRQIVAPGGDRIGRVTLRALRIMASYPDTHQPSARCDASGQAVPCQRRVWRLFAVLAFAAGIATLSAHEVIVEPIVDLTLEPRGDQLLVRLHVPATATGDAALPGLLRGDPAAIGDRLRIVAADIARNLELQQEEASLADPAVTVRPAEDRASIEVELRYAIRAGAAGFSARLNTFSAKEGPVRTNARYRPPSGGDQAISVTGPPTRIAFDPAASAVLPQFAVRGVRALFGNGDGLFFLVCLLLPVRRARPAAALFIAVACGQAIAIAASLMRPGMSPEWLAGVGMVAASAVVIVAAQNVVRAQLRWAVALALLFGAANGVALSEAAAASGQFAGAHRLLAMATFSVVIVAAELWLGALMWAFRGWLDQSGVPDRFLVILGSAIVAHDAFHRLADRGLLLAQEGSVAAGHALIWLTLGWIGALLLVAIGNAVSGAPKGAHAS
jgi:hypothetical protein